MAGRQVGEDPVESLQPSAVSRQPTARRGALYGASRRRRHRPSGVLAAFAVLVLTTGLGGPVRAQEAARADRAAAALRPPSDSAAARFVPPRPRPFLAALEGLGLNVLVNRFDAWALDAHDTEGLAWPRVTPRTWSRNIRLGWTWDTDAFVTNMFAHPYHGSMYFNAGRANGLNFWESAPLAFLGSLTWEYFGEDYQPSMNDFYNTGFGGITLGEVYHRLGTLVRDNRARGTGRVLRELAALPLDPMGGLDRLLRGGFTRVGPNPPDRSPGNFGLVVAVGGRVAVDSGAGGNITSSSILADLAYGDPFRQPYAKPFDVFRVRLQVSPDGGGLNVLRVSGRLWALDFTPEGQQPRRILTVNQKTEYLSSPAFKFGGQSVEVGLVSAITAARNVDVRTEIYAEGLMMGAVDAPNTGIPGSERTYDFGPGMGATATAAVLLRGTPVLSARWHFTYLHSVSGSPADHYTQFASVETVLPVTATVGMGAYAGLYRRRSSYRGRLGEATHFPEFRLFLTWQPNHILPLDQAP